MQLGGIINIHPLRPWGPWGIYIQYEESQVIGRVLSQKNDTFMLVDQLRMFDDHVDHITKSECLMIETVFSFHKHHITTMLLVNPWF